MKNDYEESVGFIDRKIKGNINETIIEFLLKDLGFYVIKLGQEHKVEPIVQLQNYFNRVDSNFNIYTNLKLKDGFEQIRSLPDFLIVKNNHRPLLFEVKYRSEGLYINNKGICKKLDNLFAFYKNSYLLLTCKHFSYFKNRAFYRLDNVLDDNKKNLKTHFFVFYRSKDKYFWASFEEFLVYFFQLDKSKFVKKIEKYEKLVDIWF